MDIQDLARHLQKIEDSLPYFIKTVFAQAVELSGLTGTNEKGEPNNFVHGDYLDTVGEFLQSNFYTIRISARDHFKSMSLYAHFMWTLYKSRDMALECQYFSFKTDLAAYHIGKIKALISASPAFKQCIDLKPTAQGICMYQWQGSDKIVTLEPNGLMSFKRGQHPNGPLYLDDPLKDPANKLDPTTINKVNEAFKAEILPMPHGELHVVGTPQTHKDFFFDDAISLSDDEVWSKENKKFRVRIQPAIKSRATKEVIFPEWMSYDALIAQEKIVGDKLFAQEYLCSPAYSEDSYFTREQLTACVDHNLTNVDLLEYKEKYKGAYEVQGGYDIGKKSHPSHFVAWELKGDKRRIILSKWMDKWDYVKQIDWIKTAIDSLGIDKIYYDATRGELSGFDEIDYLPLELEPVNFNTKTKNSMATVLYREVYNKRIILPDEQRLIEQMLAVNNDLVAIETPQGHGDSFWSMALSLFSLTIPDPNIRDL